MTRWVVIDIGCLECGTPSDLIGVVDSKDAAIHWGATPRDEIVNWCGDGLLVAFPLEET